MYHKIRKICISVCTEVYRGPRYNDSVCYQRFCCKIEFAGYDLSKASVTDTFEHFYV